MCADGQLSLHESLVADACSGERVVLIDQDGSRPWRRGERILVWLRGRRPGGKIERIEVISRLR